MKDFYGDDIDVITATIKSRANGTPRIILPNIPKELI